MFCGIGMIYRAIEWTHKLFPYGRSQGVFGSGICFILITIGIRELGAARANIFGNLIPVVTAIVSFFLLKEAMPFVKILGIFIVILGLLLSQSSSLRVKPMWGREGDYK